MSRTETYAARVQGRSAFHELRGVRYHVSEWGDSDKPLIVMLHGWGDSGRSFQFVVDAMREDWLVIAPDWRGFGQSRNQAQCYWFPDYIADLDALLQTYQPDLPVRLLGHSMGANIAGLYAGTFPERVSAFINVEGFGLAESDPVAAPANYRRWIEQSRSIPAYKTYTDFAELAERVRRRSPNLDFDRAMFIAHCWAFRNNSGVITLRADPAHKLPNAVQYRRAEALACWSQVTAPVLQIVGADTTLKDAAQAWLVEDPATYHFPDAETVVIPGAGHMVHFEQPASLAAAVEAFLANCRSSIV
jgi:pimeloyl-ACP methyl ester carboxylesterase